MMMCQIKRIAGDCSRNARWVMLSIRPNESIRLIGIGTKYVRIMFGNGKVAHVLPEMIDRCW